MARIEYQPANLKAYGVAPEEISFYLVAAGGAAAPTFGAGCASGMVASITYVSTGKNTVKLSVPVYKVIGYEAAVDDISSPDFSIATLGPFSNEATTTPLSFTLNTVTSAAATDLAANRKIRIRLRVQRTNWGNMT